MKEIEIIIKPERLDMLKTILDEAGAKGAMITQIFGYGHQRGGGQIYTREDNHGINLLPKLSVRTVVTDEIVDIITDNVLNKMKTNSFGDGKVFVKDVFSVVKVRTGETGEDAI